MKAWLIFFGTLLAVDLSAVLFFGQSWASGFGMGLGAALGITKLYIEIRRIADRDRDISDVF